MAIKTGSVRVKTKARAKDFVAAAVEADETYLTGCKRVKAILSKLDPFALSEELLQMQSASTMRTLSSADVFSSRKKKFMDAILQASAHRSRAVEIKMVILRASVNAEQVIATLKSHIEAAHGDDIRSRFKTIRERTDFVNSFMAASRAALNRLEGVSDMADVVIDDFDATGWTSKRIIDVLALDASDLKRSSTLPS